MEDQCKFCKAVKSVIYGPQHFSTIEDSDYIQQIDWNECVCCGEVWKIVSFFDPAEDEDETGETREFWLDIIKAQDAEDT